MKKFITLLFILTLGFSYSQENIAWNRVDLYVPADQAGAYLEAMDEFYSNIEMPDGVSVSLVRYFYKAADVKATHSIVFAGPVDGIIELRQIRSGEGYEAFYDDLDVLDLQIDALNAARSMDVDQAEAILRVELGSEVDKMSSAELKRDLYIFARNNPKLFIQLVNDENVQLRNIAIKASVIIRFSNLIYICIIQTH